MKNKPVISRSNIFYILSLMFKYNGISFNDMPKILEDNGLSDFKNGWDGNLRRLSMSTPEYSYSSIEKKFFYDTISKKYYPLESFFDKKKDVIIHTINFLLENDEISVVFKKNLLKLLNQIKNNNLFINVKYKKERRDKIFGKNSILESFYDIVDFEDEIKIDDFISIINTNDIYKVGDVKIDNCIRRKTEIEFLPVITNELWDDNEQWIYFITFNNYIIKIGGTIKGLKGRAGSYLCGTRWSRKSGTCSTTNFIIYNACLEHIQKGVCVELYGYKIPEYKMDINIFGTIKNVKPIIYKEYEKYLLNKYFDITGDKPILSNNS
jgi:hypothetical protein